MQKMYGDEAPITKEYHRIVLKLRDNEQLEEYREHLLRYCELDTYAMVKVWELLKEI